MLRHAARGHLASAPILLGDCSVVKLLLSTAHPKQNGKNATFDVLHPCTCRYWLEFSCALMGSQLPAFGRTTSGHSCRKIKAQRPSRPPDDRRRRRRQPLRRAPRSRRHRRGSRAGSASARRATSPRVVAPRADTGTSPRRHPTGRCELARWRHQAVNAPATRRCVTTGLSGSCPPSPRVYVDRCQPRGRVALPPHPAPCLFLGLARTRRHANAPGWRRGRATAMPRRRRVASVLSTKDTARGRESRASSQANAPCASAS